MDGAVAAGRALVHNLGGDDPVQGEHVAMGKGCFGGVLLDEAERGEVIDYFAPGTGRDGGQVTAFLHGAHLFEGQGVAFDGGGRMGVARAGVLLESGNPRNLNRGHQDPFAQGGDLLDAGKQPRRDGELRLVAHGASLAIGQVWVKLLVKCRQREG